MYSISDTTVHTQSSFIKLALTRYFPTLARICFFCSISTSSISRTAIGSCSKFFRDPRLPWWNTVLWYQILQKTSTFTICQWNRLTKGTEGVWNQVFVERKALKEKHIGSFSSEKRHTFRKIVDADINKRKENTFWTRENIHFLQCSACTGKTCMLDHVCDYLETK